jgi:hypothetical protein
MSSGNNTIASNPSSLFPASRPGRPRRSIDKRQGKGRICFFRITKSKSGHRTIVTDLIPIIGSVLQNEVFQMIQDEILSL